MYDIDMQKLDKCTKYMINVDIAMKTEGIFMFNVDLVMLNA